MEFQMKIKWKFKQLRNTDVTEGTDVSEVFRINAGRNIHEKRSEGKQAPKFVTENAIRQLRDRLLDVERFRKQFPGSEG